MNDIRYVRKENESWTTQRDDRSLGAAQLQVLQDLRDELQKLNRLLYCENLVRIPRILDGIRKNTVSKRKRKSS